MRGKASKYLVFLLSIVLTACLASGCASGVSATELEKIHQGIFYNIDEDIINMDNFMDMVDELSLKKYMGRMTGTEENILAVDYIADQFEKTGLQKPECMDDFTQDYKLDFALVRDTANVAGVIPGTGESDEVIIIGAHLDHLGYYGDEYYPGALDNASGVAAITEIARTLKTNKIAPKKTILFLAFNGEETGFTGSEYYVNNPLYPLDKSILINMDQIGSKVILPLYLISNEKEGRKLKNDFYKYGKELNMDCEKVSHLTCDHRLFEEKGVDVVTLVHPFSYNDGYHTPNDNPDIVSKDRAREVINLVLYYLDKNAF